MEKCQLFYPRVFKLNRLIFDKFTLNFISKITGLPELIITQSVSLHCLKYRDVGRGALKKENSLILN